jgi:hypothetical protein
VVEGACAAAEDEAVERAAGEGDKCEREEEDVFDGEAEGEGGVDGGFFVRAELLDWVGAAGDYGASGGDELREGLMDQDLRGGPRLRL